MTAHIKSFVKNPQIEFYKRGYMQRLAYIFITFDSFGAGYGFSHGESTFGYECLAWAVVWIAILIFNWPVKK